MSSVNVLSINILNDLDWWQQRRDLLVDGIAELQPDMVALQEVSLPLDNAAWLADHLGFKYRFLATKISPMDDKEGIAILSRYPILNQQVLDLESQSRVAQLVRVEIAGKPLIFVNGHFYFWPGHAPERLTQINLLLKWLNQLPDSMAVIICGDFNALPDSASIERMHDYYQSAFAANHGREPDYTVPTPLVRMSKIETVKYYLRDLITNRNFKPWKGTLDYIFTNDKVQVNKCEVVLDQPAVDNRHLYPSDHFSLAAELELL